MSFAKTYSEATGVTMRLTSAKEIGISHGTLSRIERGEKMDADTLVKVLKWLFTEVE